MEGVVNHLDFYCLIAWLYSKLVIFVLGGPGTGKITFIGPITNTVNGVYLTQQ